MASSQYSGRSSGRLRCSSTMRTRQMAGLARMIAASVSKAKAAAGTGHCRRSARISMPSSTAVASTTSGTARGVERSARPESLAVKSLNTDPSSDGESKGWLPTPTSAPTASSSRKNERCRQRTANAASSASTTRPKLRNSSQTPWVYSMLGSIHWPSLSLP